MTPWEIAAFASMGLTIAVVAVVYHLVPRLSRPDLYFAVTVPAPFRDSDEASGILGRYRVQVWLHAAIAASMVAAAFVAGRFLLASAGILWQVAGSMAAFLAARRRVAPHAVAPTAIREAELAPRPSALPGGTLGQLGPFLLLAVAAAVLAARWDAVPARFPVHWGWSGAPDRFAARSLPGVFGTLGVGALLCVMMLLLGWGIQRGARPVHVSGAAGEGERAFRRATLGVLLAAEYLIALTLSAVALLPLVGAHRELLLLLLVVEPLFTIAIVVFIVRAGQRLATARTDGEAPVGDRTPDAKWKGGLFYINRDDPALFVQKRVGLGYTLNFGNRWSWVILAALLAVPLAAVLLSAAIS
jgi:uncharacterized membrane protein